MSTSRPKKKRAAAPRGYHHGNLRQALLEAGLQMLEDTAHGEPSLRELSRQAGVSANAAYRHFADKEALLQALAAEGFQRLALAQAKAARSAKKSQEAHRAAGKAYVAFARANPGLFKLMFGRAPSEPTGELKSAGEFAFNALRAGAAQALKLDIEDPKVAYAAIRSWSLVHGLSQLILAGHLDDLGADLEPVIDAVLRAPPPPA